MTFLGPNSLEKFLIIKLGYSMMTIAQSKYSTKTERFIAGLHTHICLSIYWYLSEL